MPIVLDYDSGGNVVGGHVVDELHRNPLVTTPYHDSLQIPLYRRQNSPSEPLHERDSIHPQSQHFHSAQIHNAPIRSLSPTQTSGGAFLDSFTKLFAHDAHTMRAFEMLFTNYNKSVIGETDFYVGAYILLSSTESQHLLPGLVKVLPASWQAKDLTWLHEAAEALYEEHVNGKGTKTNMKEKAPLELFKSIVPYTMSRKLSNAIDYISSEIVAKVSPLSEDPEQSRKRVKRPPANGFRTSYATTTPKARPMFVDPAVLLIHKPVVGDMPYPDKGMDTFMLDEKPSRKGLVKLKITHKPRAAKSDSGRLPQEKPRKRTKAKGSLLRETDSVDESIDDSVKAAKREERAKENGAGKLTSQGSGTRKGRHRYGEMYAAEIEHFGHFPTRRAVIARASRPYVHLSCGKGFSHPMDVKDHHRNKERVKSGAGCSGKGGIPQGDDDTWDAHPSSRVEYPDLNYTKVKDGYVLLDQKSRDRIDNAVIAGLEYLTERKDLDYANSADEEMEMEDVDETETRNDTANRETDVEQSYVRSATLGLRERLTRPSKYGA